MDESFENELGSFELVTSPLELVDFLVFLDSVFPRLWEILRQKKQMSKDTDVTVMFVL